MFFVREGVIDCVAKVFKLVRSDICHCRCLYIIYALYQSGVIGVYKGFVVSLVGAVVFRAMYMGTNF
jgi:hypothetical protein